MKITDIVNVKDTKYIIYIDDEYWYILDAEIILANNLSVGLDVDDDMLNELLISAEYKKAKSRAYYLLGYRDHSKKELFDKLLKSAREEVVSDIIELLTQQGLLNDEEYATKRARYYLVTKKWGKNKVVMELYRRGISRQLANAVIDICEVDTIQNIKDIIEKKYYRNISDFKGRQKIVAALMRMGFSYSDINQAFNDYIDECD